MPDPITPDRVRDAAGILRVCYLQVMTDPGDPWGGPVDVAEPLADLLDRQADAIADLIRDGGPASLTAMAGLPGYRALFALVEKIEGSHR